MDFDRNAAVGYSVGVDRDEGNCRGTGDFRKCNCYYAGYRYDLSRGWSACDGDCDRELAGLYDGKRAGSAEWDHVRDDYGRSFESATGSKCRLDANGYLLHGGVSPE